MISENESLFTYPNGRPFSSYQNPNFNPVVVIPENVSQAISDVCGTNYECIYDYYVTGDEHFGQISANFSDQFDTMTNTTATGKYILNIDVCHMVSVVCLLRVTSCVTRPMPSLHLTSPVIR